MRALKATQLSTKLLHAPIDYWLGYDVLNVGDGDRYPVGVLVLPRFTMKPMNAELLQLGESLFLDLADALPGET